MSKVDTFVWIVAERLSDGSTVYNVEIKDSLPANTNNDATELACKIVDAINEHTNCRATLMET